ncbi:hypothetical protein HZS_3151 [Henneguya salminicola]|nr:hypothetical protein HZS_3151 [Henneguya salminicola]
MNLTSLKNIKTNMRQDIYGSLQQITYYLYSISIAESTVYSYTGIKREILIKESKHTNALLNKFYDISNKGKFENSEELCQFLFDEKIENEYQKSVCQKAKEIRDMKADALLAPQRIADKRKLQQT